MFDLMSDCTVSTDRDGNAGWINAMLDQITCLNRYDVIGKSFRDSCP
jgi:hypothetical protein